MKNVFKRFIPIISIIPLIIGTVGYLVSGEMITNALYDGIALYSMGQNSDAYNGYIEFARWTAPLVTATAFLCILKSIWDKVCWRISLFCKSDSVAVYSDEDVRIKFEKGTKAIYPRTDYKGYAKSHIIMFSTDQKSLKFYEEHREQLKKKDVYIGLKNLELGLIHEVSDVTLFDINGSISRVLWKTIALWKTNKEKLDVVIYGSNSLAQEILSTGLQLNLFSPNQHVQYHLISDNHLFQVKHQDIKLMNSDEIYYYETNDERIWNAISSADVVIVAEQIPIDLLQTITVRARENSVYYYSPEAGDAAGYIEFGKLIPFGRDSDIFTDKNIRRQELIKQAVILNEQYADKNNAENIWNNLPGFIKASNISSADYGEVVASLSEKVSDEELAELEHIRWCRFHYLNYWRYGIPENGKNKDNERRIHKDLVAYAQLDEEEKAKDVETIKTFQKMLQK